MVTLRKYLLTACTNRKQYVVKHNDAGNVEASAETGSLTKTFLVWFAVVSVVYWLYYFIATELAKAKIRFLWDPVRKVIYPPVAFEDLYIENINDMLIMMLILSVAIAGLAVFLKALKSRGKKPQPA